MENNFLNRTVQNVQDPKGIAVSIVKLASDLYKENKQNNDVKSVYDDIIMVNNALDSCTNQKYIETNIAIANKYPDIIEMACGKLSVVDQTALLTYPESLNRYILLSAFDPLYKIMKKRNNPNWKSTILQVGKAVGGHLIMSGALALIQSNDADKSKE